MGIRLLRLVGLTMLLGACGVNPGRPFEDALQLPQEDRELTQPTLLYSLGSADGPPFSSFEHLAHVAFDEDDNLYVLDRGAGKIYVYDRQGRFTREIGKSGRGPGELAFPVRLAVTRDGMVVVSDLRQTGFALFDRKGTYQRNQPFPFRQAMGGVELRPHPIGGFVSENQPLLGAKGDAGKIRITWHSVPTGSPRVITAVAWSPDRLASATVGPRETVFLPRFAWGVLPKGETAVTRTAEYRVDILDGNGRMVRRIERPIAPRRVTARDREGERQRRLNALTGGEAIPASTRQIALKEVDRLQYADVMPVIQDLATDRAGRLWILRDTRPDARSGRIDLVSGDGVYLGTIQGTRLPVAFSRGGLVATIEEDSLGVQKVMVSRIAADWRPGTL